jgi:hypothetical protein
VEATIRQITTRMTIAAAGNPVMIADVIAVTADKPLT